MNLVTSHNFITLEFRRPEVRRLKSRCGQSCLLSGGSKGEFVSLPFLASRNCPTFLGSLLYHSDLYFPCQISFSDSNPPASIFLFIKTLVMGLDLPGSL